MAAEDADLTGLLGAACHGDASARARLAELVYADLRERAEALMRREAHDVTVQATTLIHDAYLKLIRQDQVSWADRNHFFAMATTTMRRLLVDQARRRRSDKRGGGELVLSLDDALGHATSPPSEVLAVDAALTRLEALNPQHARIVELRFFGGLSVEEVADELGLSKRAVERQWTMIAAWLRRELAQG